MAARRPPVAVLLVWLALLLLLLHGWSQLWRSSGVKGTAAHSSGSSSGRTTPRKMLAARKFDFSAFGVHHHRHRGHRHRREQAESSHHSPREVRPEPSPGGDGDEIDPRYGMEKRLVPTGPNPLHH